MQALTTEFIHVHYSSSEAACSRRALILITNSYAVLILLFWGSRGSAVQPRQPVALAELKLQQPLHGKQYRSI